MQKMFIDLMYIPMIKQEENEAFVWYKIKITMQKDDKPLIEKIGLFKFDKLNEVQNKDIETVIQLIEDKTDPELLIYRKEILIRCFVIMNKCKKVNNYPDKVSFQSG